LAVLVVLTAAVIVAWRVTDGFYFGERPHTSCIGDPATCAAAA
jgi:hypothetical protein